MVTCLIVDDSEVACAVASKTLEYLGVSPTEMLDSVAALEWCKKTMPDLIILDFMMPNMDGMQFLKELHKVSGGESVYVIACTARSDEESVKSMRILGVNDYIIKPFPPEVFISKLRNSGLV